MVEFWKNTHQLKLLFFIRISIFSLLTGLWNKKYESQTQIWSTNEKEVMVNGLYTIRKFLMFLRFEND